MVVFIGGDRAKIKKERKKRGLASFSFSFFFATLLEAEDLARLFALCSLLSLHRGSSGLASTLYCYINKYLFILLRYGVRGGRGRGLADIAPLVA